MLFIILLFIGTVSMSSEEDEGLMLLLLLFSKPLMRKTKIEIDIVVDLVLVYIKPLDLMKKTKN